MFILGIVDIMVRYDTKIGIEIIVLFSLIFGGVAIAMIIESDYLALLILLPLIIAITTLLKKTYYIIDGNILRIKSWFLVNIKIDINNIKKIAETNNPLSSPAGSLDRLGVYYNKSSLILISPKDKQGFIEHILQINPKIEIKYKKRKLV